MVGEADEGKEPVVASVRRIPNPVRFFEIAGKERNIPKISSISQVFGCFGTDDCFDVLFLFLSKHPMVSRLRFTLESVNAVFSVPGNPIGYRILFHLKEGCDFLP